MRKFVIRTSIFMIVVVMLLLLLVTITNIGLQKSEFGNLKEWREILAGEVQADVLIHGSSRAWVQYNPAIIDSALQVNSYNMGMDGSPFDVQYLRFKAYLLQNKPPKMIIQNVDMDLLDANQEVFQKYQFLPFLHNQQFKQLLGEQRMIDFSDFYLPWSLYYGQPKPLQVGIEEFFHFKHYSSDKYKGFKASTEEWDDKRFEQRKQRGKIAWHIDEASKALFEKFVLECKQMNIQLVLVYAPIYYELQKYVVDFEGSRRFYASFANRNNLIFLDYSLCNLSHDKNAFYNATHLNSYGADIFTKKLSSDLSSYFVE